MRRIFVFSTPDSVPAVSDPVNSRDKCGAILRSIERRYSDFREYSRVGITLLGLVSGIAFPPQQSKAQSLPEDVIGGTGQVIPWRAVPADHPELQFAFLAAHVGQRKEIDDRKGRGNGREGEALEMRAAASLGLSVAEMARIAHIVASFERERQRVED